MIELSLIFIVLLMILLVGIFTGTICNKCPLCESRLTVRFRKDGSSTTCRRVYKTTYCLRCKYKKKEEDVYHGKNCQHY